jgi:transposase
MQKKYIVTLTESEQATLVDIIKKRNEKSIKVKRAYILLATDENGDKSWSDKQISETYHVRTKTVENLRQRFVEDGFEIALNGKPKEPKREKIFDAEVEAKLIATRCSEVPEGFNKWTLRLLADKMVELNYVETISHESVRQMLKKTKLSPGW